MWWNPHDSTICPDYIIMYLLWMMAEIGIFVMSAQIRLFLKISRDSAMLCYVNMLVPVDCVDNFVDHWVWRYSVSVEMSRRLRRKSDVKVTTCNTVLFAESDGGRRLDAWRASNSWATRDTVVIIVYTSERRFFCTGRSGVGAGELPAGR